jgi:hypothetical protein
MKISLNLTEVEIKAAIIEYAKKHKGLDVKTVSLSHYQADSRDPREYSYFSATASE